MKAAAVLIGLLLLMMTFSSGASSPEAVNENAAWNDPTDPVSGLPPPESFVPGELLVKLAPGVTPDRQLLLSLGIESATALIGDVSLAPDRAAKFHSNGIERIYLVVLEPGSDLGVALSAIRSDPRIVYAEPNLLFELQSVPNDPRFNLQLGLENNGGFGGTPDADIDAPEAWAALGRYGQPFDVAIIDSGIRMSHEDLASSLWTDSDGSHGIDLVRNDAVPDDEGYHGTFLAGVVGARTDNGKGIAGVNSDAKIASIKAFDGNGLSDEATLVRAVGYAAENGFQLVLTAWVSKSFGSPASPLYDIMKANDDILFVAASGNDNCNSPLPVSINNIPCENNNDLRPSYPASFDLPNIISVMGASFFGDFARWNYGPISVDLAAPDNSYSTSGQSDTGYVGMGGTSVSAAFVAGAASLYWGQQPQMTGSQVKQDIILSVDRYSHMAANNFASGRLNLRNLVTNTFTSIIIPTVDADASEIDFATGLAFATLHGDSPNANERVLLECHSSGGHACSRMGNFPHYQGRGPRISTCRDNSDLTTCSAFTGSVLFAYRWDQDYDFCTIQSFLGGVPTTAVPCVASDHLAIAATDQFFARGSPDPASQGEQGWHVWATAFI